MLSSQRVLHSQTLQKLENQNQAFCRDPISRPCAAKRLDLYFQANHSRKIHCVGRWKVYNGFGNPTEDSLLKNISAMSKPSEWKQKGEQVLTRFISRTKKTVANMQNAGIEEMIGGKRTTPNKRGGSV